MKGLEIMSNMSGLQYNTPSLEHTPNIQFICPTYFGELEKTKLYIKSGFRAQTAQSMKEVVP